MNMGNNNNNSNSNSNGKYFGKRFPKREREYSYAENMIITQVLLELDLLIQVSLCLCPC